MSARGLNWNQRLQVIVSSPQSTRVLPVRLSAATTEVPDAIGLPAPDFVLPTGGGIGYGDFALDDTSLAYLLAHLPEIADPLTRGAAWVTLLEQMLDGRVAPAAIMTLALRALPLEGDELNVARILGYSVQTYWMFLDAPARDATSPSLERAPARGLDHATTASLKSAWFSALRDTARSQPVVEVARANLEKDGRIASASAFRARLHHTGAGARRPRKPGVEGNPRRAIDPNGES